MRSFNPTHPLIQDILARFTSLSSCGKSVKFCWIPSHAGIVGNELADAAAKQAASAPPMRRLLLRARNFYPVVSVFMNTKWQRKWDSETRNKLRIIKPTLKSWRSSSRRSRQEEATLCRFCIGHTFATHGRLLRDESKPKCPGCDEDLTVAHVLLACCQNAGARLRHLGHLPPMLTLRNLLGDYSRWVKDCNIFSFVRATVLLVIYSSR